MTALDVTQALHCIDNSMNKRCVPALEDSYHTTGHAHGWAVILCCSWLQEHVAHPAKAANRPHACLWADADRLCFCRKQQPQASLSSAGVPAA